MAEPGMVERVARAICRVDLINIAIEDNITLSLNGLDAAVHKEWPRAVPNAIAAIKAMREPTEAMLFAADWLENGTLDAWRAMIDAALSSSTRGE